MSETTDPRDTILVWDEDAHNEAIVQTVLASPAMLWRVLTADTIIAGPWSNDGTWLHRRFPDDDIAAAVERSPGDATVSRWQWVSGDTRSEERRTLPEAQAWCDARLREAGVLLVDGEGK